MLSIMCLCTNATTMTGLQAAHSLSGGAQSLEPFNKEICNPMMLYYQKTLAYLDPNPVYPCLGP